MKIGDLFSESYKLKNDGSVISVRHPDTDAHMGNIMQSRRTNPFEKPHWKAYSPHWNLRQNHSSKKSAAEWLRSVHDTAMNLEKK